MKFRIMENSNGKYVQVKNIFGLWRNWLIGLNCTCITKYYYDYSTDNDKIVNLVIENNTPKPKPKDVLLKEFTV